MLTFRHGVAGWSGRLAAPLLLGLGVLAGTPALCLAAGGASSFAVPEAGLAPLGGSVTSHVAGVAAHVRTAMFEPAPMPDPDASGPNGAIDPRAGVGPRLLSSKDGFEGEGFFKGSSEHASVDSRKQPAAGLGLNMPLGDAKTP